MEHGNSNLIFPAPSDNLKIRYWESGDTKCVISGAEDSYIPLTTSIPADCNEVGALDWIERQNKKIDEGTDLPLCITRASTNEALGMVGIFELNVESESARGGYWISPQHRGKGIVRKILKIVTPWAAEKLHLNVIELLIEPDNIASRKAAEAAGYSKKQVLKAHTEINGVLRDMQLYAWES